MMRKGRESWVDESEGDEDEDIHEVTNDEWILEGKHTQSL
jgi:hypothetical protein